MRYRYLIVICLLLSVMWGTYTILDTKMIVPASTLESQNFRYEIREETPGIFRIYITSKDSSIEAMNESSTQKESALSKGRWLVMCFAIWSLDDIKSIDTVIELSQSKKFKPRIGIRAFNKYRELQEWCPQIRTTSSPVWLLFENGTLIEQFYGPIPNGKLTDKDLMRLVELKFKHAEVD